jgi:ribosomal protein S18 acetylase RimI-like enzyme
VRQAYQALFTRREVILIAERDDASAPTGDDVPLTLRIVRSHPELEPWAAVVDAAYHPGYAEAWRAPLEWGEQLVLATVGEEVLGFGWLQVGTKDGLGCYYGKTFLDEYRVLRVGVLPAFRRRGVNRSFYRHLLRDLFSRGARRVYVDCARDNIPSLKAQLAAGFRPVAEIEVRGPILGENFVRWDFRLDRRFYDSLRS